MYREGGVPELKPSIGWFWHAGTKLTSQLPINLTDSQFSMLAEHFTYESSAPELDIDTAVWTLPTIDALVKNGNPLPSDYRNYISQVPSSPFWKKLNYVNDTDQFDVPTLHVNSWYDGSVDETLRLFNLFRQNSVSKRSADNQLVIISPTTHCGSPSAGTSLMVGERELGDASWPYMQQYINWFDHWLKENNNQVVERDKVQYYLMGKNTWQFAPTWPVPETDIVQFYLHENTQVGEEEGNGLLSTDMPDTYSTARYIYDAKNPVPSVGGTDGAFDQSSIETRDDVLVYSTRDMWLSPVVATHSQLCRLGVPAELHVWEGLEHCFHYNNDLPEASELHNRMLKFFERHLV